MAAAVGGIVGGGLQAAGAVSAAHTQADAAKYAADQQYKAAQDSTNFQKGVYGDTKNNLSPYLQTGTDAQNQLASLTMDHGADGRSYFGTTYADQNGEFQSPTAVTEQNDPGYKFRLEQGQKALDRSAAARGNATSGGQMKALTDYSQGAASNEYGNVYNRALQNYTTNANQFNQGRQNQFGYLQTLAGAGQNAAAGQGSAGNQAASNIGAINNTAATSAGNYATQGANAVSAGQMGVASGIGSAVNSVSSYFQNRPQSTGSGNSAYSDIMDD